jgi:hypothetical protein
MLTAQIYDHAARLRSFEIAAEMRGSVATPRNVDGLTPKRASPPAGRA